MGANCRHPIFRRIRRVAARGWVWLHGPASCKNYGSLSPDMAWRLSTLAPRLAPHWAARRQGWPLSRTAGECHACRAGGTAPRPGPASSAGPGPSRKRQGRRPVSRRAWPPDPRPVCRRSRPAPSRQGSPCPLPPGPPPLVNRRRAQPQGPGDLPGVRVLREHLCRLKPYLLPAGPARPVSPPPSGYLVTSA
jgi:hypothetical protein